MRDTKLMSHMISFASLLSFILLFLGSKDVNADTIIPFEHPGGVATYPHAINNNGDIVGQYNTGIDNRGFLLSGNTFTDIIFPGSTYTSALGINDRGDIVGTYQDSDNNFHGFLLSSGDYTTIDYPDYPTSRVSGINNKGDMVGTYGTGGFTQGYFFDGVDFSPISYPGSDLNFVYDINNEGAIFGTYGIYDLSSLGNEILFHGFTLSESIFNTFNVPEAYWTFVRGGNDVGDIVGNIGPDVYERGFVLSEGEYSIFGGRRTYGIDINNDMVMVGWVLHPRSYGFIIDLKNGFPDFPPGPGPDPIPEPSTILLLGAGLIGVVGIARRRKG